jgi:signal transduction histidine kinase
VLFAPIFFAAVQVIGCTVAARGQLDATTLDGLGYLLLLIGPAALLLRRRWPLAAAAVGLLAATAYLVLGYPGGPFFLAALVALFGAVRRSNRYAVWTVAALAYAPYLLLAIAGGRLTIDGRTLAQPTLGQVLVVGAGLAVVLALADAAKVRVSQLAERARAQAESDRAQREQTRRQASDERLRIARELHDVLGHHLSLINVRAGVGLHLLDSQPDEARAALVAIKVASAEALREVRGVLAALNPQTDAAPRSPAPGLAEVDGLADDARAAGLPVTVHRHGAAVALPATVDRAAYRIVQEALTNVRRHAGADAVATVDITYAGPTLDLRIDDTGTATPAVPTPDDGGNGIPGMRERAAALGGSLTAGPRIDGGFRIDAVLPVLSPSTRETSPSTRESE